MLTFILIIILISLLIRLILPYALPRLMAYWFRKQYKAGQNWQNQQKPEGSVDIKYQPSGSGKNKDRFTDAEYVDFEEIKEPEKQ